MFSLPILLSIILLVLAFFHFLWGLKVWFPVRNEKKLARTVAGFKNIEKMPSPVACFIVVLLLTSMSLIPLLAGGIFTISILPGSVIAMMTFVTGFIFLFRGVLGYLPVFKRLTPEQPFRTYDMLFYSPLCLFIGGGFFYLVWLYMDNL